MISRRFSKTTILLLGVLPTVLALAPVVPSACPAHTGDSEGAAWSAHGVDDASTGQLAGRAAECQALLARSGRPPLSEQDGARFGVTAVDRDRVPPSRQHATSQVAPTRVARLREGASGIRGDPIA